MNRVPFIEVFLLGLPESYLFLLMCSAFSRKKINYKTYVLFSIIFSLIIYLARLLPVQFGINTILTIGFMILYNVKIIKINVLKSIQATILSFMLRFISEFLNIALIKFVIHEDLNKIFGNSLLKAVYTLPSLFIFALFIFILDKVLERRTKTKTRGINLRTMNAKDTP